MTTADIRKELEMGPPGDSCTEGHARTWDALCGLAKAAAEYRAAVGSRHYAAYEGGDRYDAACARLVKAEAALLEMLPEEMR